MTAQNSAKEPEGRSGTSGFEPKSETDLTAEVHFEYARYLEKRDAARRGLREDHGRLRRSGIHAQLAS